MITYQISRDGILFIANREALVTVAYPDGPHPSIGFGHNSALLKIGDQITVKQAFDFLREDLASRVANVNKRLKVSVEQNQFDALVSLHYQSGNRYMPQAVELINQGRISDAAALWPTYDKRLDGGESAGLRKRRLLELAMFSHGDYGVLDQILYWKDDPHKTKPEVYHLQPGDID